MDAKDLMIGDWIRYNNGTMEVLFNTRVTEVGKDFVKTSKTGGDECFEDEIEPIPITPEILEKNGFHYTNNHTLKGADTYVLRLDQRGFDFTITIKLNDYIALDSYDDRMYRLAEISTGKWYVHELQHALRLCGIEKEIEL